jgi:uncharacterized protein YggE
MNSNVTVSVRSILLAGLVLLALVTAYLLGGRGDVVASPASAAQDEAASQPERVMRMVGSGEASAVPDQMSFSLSVTAKRDDLDEALGAANSTMNRVLGVLDDQGVKRSDVQTTGLQMYPEYDYPAYGPPVLTGYRVTQRARVDVRELADGGSAVSSAVDAGGNGVRVTDIRLEVGDPDSVIAKARDAAVDEATAKARQYAESTGQELGDVVSVREIGSPGAQVAPRALGRVSYDAASLAELSSVPIRAGKDDLHVRVEVVWSFV